MKTYYILARGSYSANEQYITRFAGSGAPRVTSSMLHAALFEDKKEVEYLLSGLNYYRAIELTEKDVFVMRLTGK